MRKTFGQQLQEWIDLAGINRAELARRIGKSANYVSNLVRDYSPSSKSGMPQPSKAVVDSIARALGLPIDQVRVAAGYAPEKLLDTHKTALEGSPFAALFFEYEGLTTEQAKHDVEVAVNVLREMIRRKAEEARQRHFIEIPQVRKVESDK